MRSRATPSSVIWLAALIGLAIVAAAVACATIYLQARAAARSQADAITGGDWKRGRQALIRYSCGSCHVIPGIVAANGRVGPDLTGVGQRSEIAGRLSNDPEAMIRWVMHPQAIAPGSGMPEQGVPVGDAQDMASYLYAQK